MHGQQNDKYTEMHGQQNFKKKTAMGICHTSCVDCLLEGVRMELVTRQSA
jgi:hypothetical protein